MLAVPVGVKLEGSRRLNHSEVIACSPDELQTYGKIIFREAAGNRQRGQAAEIADGAERIRKSEVGLEISFERWRRNGQRCSDQHVVGLKESFHLSLQDFPDAVGPQIIRA